MEFDFNRRERVGPSIGELVRGLSFLGLLLMFAVKRHACGGCETPAAVPTVSSAPLTFVQSEVAVHPRLEDDEVNVAFPFSNQGSSKVVITSLQPTMRLHHRRPGEAGSISRTRKGVINAVLDLAHLNGEQRKRIIVTTMVDGKECKQDTW